MRLALKHVPFVIYNQDREGCRESSSPASPALAALIG